MVLLQYIINLTVKEMQQKCVAVNEIVLGIAAKGFSHLPFFQMFQEEQTKPQKLPVK